MSNFDSKMSVEDFSSFWGNDGLFKKSKLLCLRTSIGGTTKQYRKFNTIWKKHSNNFALFGSHLPQSFTDISNHFGGIFKSQTVTRNTIDLKNTVAQLYCIKILYVKVKVCI